MVTSDIPLWDRVLLLILGLMQTLGAALTAYLTSLATRWAGGIALAWYRKPSRVAVAELATARALGETAHLRQLYDQMRADLYGKDAAKPSGELAEPPLWLSDPQRRDRDRQHERKTG